MFVWAVLLALLLLSPVGVRAQDDFTLTPSAARVNAGETIEFTGAGFQDELVAFWATAPDLSVLGADKFRTFGGTVTLQFSVPRDAISGRWAMTAYGLESKTPVIAWFEVAGRDPGSVEPPAAVEPATAPAGTLLGFKATGFKKDERVSYWVTGPDNTIRDAGPSGLKASRSGEINFRWRVPEDAPPGRWVMTMQGIDSRVARAVAFEVR
jgi:hypothetical protein